MDSAGNAVAIWNANYTVQAAIRPAASGAWAPPLTLANLGVSAPRVAVDTVGHAVAVWNSTTSSRVLVMGADLGGGGPVLGGLKVPKKGTVHVRLIFAVAPVPWAAPLSGSPVWHFGDGKSATGVRVKHAYAHAARYTVSVTQEDAAGGTTTANATIRIARRRAARGH